MSLDRIDLVPRGWQWHVATEFMRDAISFWAVRDGSNGDREHLTKTQFTIASHKRGEIVDGPTLRFTTDEAQQIMNGLWHAGIRPRDGAGSLAHVDAQKAHLEDMRRLVFDK